MNAVGTLLDWMQQLFDIPSDTRAVDRSSRASDATLAIIPAFDSLGAPYWEPMAGPIAHGLEWRSSKEALFLACLEGVAFRMTDIMQAMKDRGTTVTEITAGGSVAAIDLLIQRQADFFQQPIKRAEDPEITCRGLAELVAVELGHKVSGGWRTSSGKVFEPMMTPGEAALRYDAWRRVLGRERSRNAQQRCSYPGWNRAKPWLIAHRGYSSHFPENTLVALREAERAGADAVEVDLRLSQDGYPVALHDERLERTTDGCGRVHHHDLASLQRLDAGSWLARNHRGERIPTFQDVISHARSVTRIFAEIKPARGPWRFRRTRRLVQTVIEAIQREGLTARTVLVSFDYPSLLFARLLDPQIQTGLVFRKLSALGQAENDGG